MKVSDIYERVCETLLEPGGLTLGLLTEAQFLSYFAAVISDFTEKVGLIKRIISAPIEAGERVYVEQEDVHNVQEAMNTFRYLYNVSLFDADKLQMRWMNQSGQPVSWYEDRLGVARIGLSPTPNVDGYTINVTGGVGFYGTLSSVANAVDFDITASAPFYGVISSFSGPIFLEAVHPALGTISDMNSSTANLNMICTLKPAQNVYELGDIIEFVPDSFAHYLTYGVLEHVFSSDSENKDVARAQYCRSRYEEGVALARAISEEAMEEVPINAR